MLVADLSMCYNSNICYVMLCCNIIIYTITKLCKFYIIIMILNYLFFFHHLLYKGIHTLTFCKVFIDCNSK